MTLFSLFSTVALAETTIIYDVSFPSDYDYALEKIWVNLLTPNGHRVGTNYRDHLLKNEMVNRSSWTHISGSFSVNLNVPGNYVLELNVEADDHGYDIREYADYVIQVVTPTGKPQQFNGKIETWHEIPRREASRGRLAVGIIRIK
jgi:hypothetical protein